LLGETLLREFRRLTAFSQFLVLALCGQLPVCATLNAQQSHQLSPTEVVAQMLHAEGAAWTNRHHFLYKNAERSDRTNGHLWHEVVVETSDGPMQRLIDEDGKPLSAAQKEAEDQRIAYFADHREAFRRATQRRREDEARMPELLREIPNIFLFRTVGVEGDSMLIAFQPNPSFHEQSYQDRVVHAMSGTLLIHTKDMRLCELNARFDHKVTFGFGIVGMLSDKSQFSFKREEVFPGQWTTTEVHVHLDGTILFLKSISQDVDSSRSGFTPVPQNLTAAEAAALASSTSF
jgi:hypothetical protein